MVIRSSSSSGIPYGNTAGRPTAATGQPYFNGEAARLELYTGTSWENIVQETPAVSSISGTYSESANSGVITINGTNFVSGATASAIGNTGVQVNAASTTFNSIMQLTATFTGLLNAQEPYDIKVTNPSNLFGIISDVLYINASPVWTTTAGSLGTFTSTVAISVSATATDSDSTITYALASGSTLPSGVTLNSATGLISGTLPSILSNTTYTFTINASDGLNTVPRVFSINSLYSFSVEYLVVGGGGASGQARRGGGGAGGMLTGNSALILSTNYAVTVGSGGAANNSGQTFSTAENSVFISAIAYGGGCSGQDSGGSANSNGRDGGSGGGGLGDSAPYGLGGTGVVGQGNSGGSGQGSLSPNYAAGGGGGAGAVGGNGNPGGVAGNGGNGLQSSITGTALYYAGGGGGGYYGGSGGQRSSGGSGGGGRGANYNTVGENGAANTGGGGGGGFNGSPANGDIHGGAGGSGVVIIAYLNTYAAITTITNTLTYDQPTRSGYRVYRFTAGTGTITF